MVHAHAARHVFERPDPTRIAALTGAMALNFAGLMLLLVPIVMPSAPPTVAPVDDPMFVDVIPIRPTPVRTVLPPIPPAPAIVHRPPTPTASPLPVEQPTAVSAVNSTPVTPPATVDTTSTGPTQPTGPIEGASLGTVFASAPKYPASEVRHGIEGTVYLRILVGTDGLPLRVDVERSSGSRNLDRAARDHVLKKWRFEPAMRNGVAVQAWGRVPIVFSLARG